MKGTALNISHLWLFNFSAFHPVPPLTLLSEESIKVMEFDRTNENLQKLTLDCDLGQNL
jgi:hypothetical protein